MHLLIFFVLASWPILWILFLALFLLQEVLPQFGSSVDLFEHRVKSRFSVSVWILESSHLVTFRVNHVLIRVLSVVVVSNFWRSHVAIWSNRRSELVILRIAAWTHVARRHCMHILWRHTSWSASERLALLRQKTWS